MGITLEQEVAVDNLQLVRSINKYLRKALKKIEEIERASERSLSNRTITFKESRQPTIERPDEGSAVKKRCMMSPVKESNSRGIDANDEWTDEPGNSNEPVDTNNSLLESPDVSPEDDTESQEDGVQVPPPVQMEPVILPAVMTFGKLELPPATIPIRKFYKAFLSNLPLTVNIPTLEEWLKLRGVDGYEDVMIFMKQKFKTSVVSYYDMALRNKLIQLDGELLEQTPVNIRLYADCFSPEVDKMAVAEERKKHGQKKKK